MPNNSTNTKRVAKNTLLLYIRMIILMLIGLFTSRVMLQALGVENYGINNVIAGFLSLFGIITSSMSAAIGRFITVELGKGNKHRLKTVFSTSIVVQFCMALSIAILIETFGIWFVDNKMNIPAGREVAAQWCLHCATLTTFISLLNIPFNSAIIAHEKMSAFAYMTIFDALWKLLVCYLIIISPIDKLITYSILSVCVSVITTTIYWVYCFRKFEECNKNIHFDSCLFREMWSFGGWNFFGNTAWMLNTQGVNMLMNVFFGVVVNAARGVAVHANGLLQQFVGNFMMALQPQITKSYANGDKNTAFKLACQGARFSFFIMLIVSLPVMIESHQILRLWLGNYPEQAEVFIVWTILSTFTTLLGNTLVTLMMAHGNIRNYQIKITLWGSLPFPLTWIAFQLGAPSIFAYYLFALVYWALIFVRYQLVHDMTGIPARMYLGGVVARTHFVGILSAIAPLALHFSMEESFVRLVLVGGISVLSTLTVIYVLGITPQERLFLHNQIISRIKLLTHK